MKLFLKRFPRRKIKDQRSKKRENVYWKVFKLSQVYPRLDVDGGGSKRKQWGPSSARSRVGLISHYPDRWCIIPILCRVTGSAAARIVAIVVPREKLESTGEWEWEERKKRGGRKKEAEKDGEKKRWRGEVAEKEENVTRRLEKLSFEVAAGSFTFRNEIVISLSLSLPLLLPPIDPSPSSFCISRVSRSSSLHIRTPSQRLPLRHEGTREGIEIPNDRSIVVLWILSDFRRFAKKVLFSFILRSMQCVLEIFFEYINFLVPQSLLPIIAILTRELEFSTTFRSFLPTVLVIKVTFITKIPLLLLSRFYYYVSISDKYISIDVKKINYFSGVCERIDATRE